MAAKLEIEIEIRDVDTWSAYGKGDRYLENEMKADLRHVLKNNLGVDLRDVDINVKVKNQ